MNQKFWLRVKAYATKKVASYHKHSRRCPRCLIWTAELGGCKSLVDDPSDPMQEIMECLHCGHKSVWRCDLMLPYLAPCREALQQGRTGG